MPTKVEFSDAFTKELNRLARKYPSILDDVQTRVDQLKNDERLGDLIPHVGYEVYKVCLQNKSSQRGKPGGFRVIYFVYLVDYVVMIMVYSKTDHNDISVNDVRERLKRPPLPTDENSEDED